MRGRAAILVLVALVLGGTARVVLGSGSAVADLRSAPSVRADARVDGSVSDADLAKLGDTVEQSASYVEQLFEHRFASRPKLLLFGNTAAFSTGLAELFDYSEGDVARAASSYGGIYDHATSTIAVNLQAIGAEDRSATLEHELTHFMMRELTAGQMLPAWFEEGVATLAERHATSGARWPDDDALVGHAIAASGRVSLAQLETLAGWHATYPRFGQSLYLFARHAASEVRARIGWRGVLDALSAVATGRSFADAYRGASGESLDDLDERIGRDRAPRLVSRPLPNGDAQWTLFTGTPLTEERVTIAGNSTYAVSFTIRTDDLGIYRGSFGSTAPPGTYLVSASGARVELATMRR